MAFVFHIVEKEIWNKSKNTGSYSPESLNHEGFIHFSKADQLVKVANSFYKGQDNLVLLKVDENLVEAELKFEPPFEAPHSQINFPHLYGPLNTNSVVKEFEFPCNSDGSFDLPKDLLK